MATRAILGQLLCLVCCGACLESNNPHKAVRKRPTI